MAKSNIELEINTKYKGEGMKRLQEGLKSANTTAKSATQAVNQVTSALGNMDNKAGKAVNAMSGLMQSFMQGGVWGMAAAGVMLVINKIVDGFSKAKQASKEAAEAAKKHFQEAFRSIRQSSLISIKGIDQRAKGQSESNQLKYEIQDQKNAQIISNMRSEGEQRRESIKNRYQEEERNGTVHNTSLEDLLKIDKAKEDVAVKQKEKQLKNAEAEKVVKDFDIMVKAMADKLQTGMSSFKSQRSRVVEKNDIYKQLPKEQSQDFGQWLMSAVKYTENAKDAAAEKIFGFSADESKADETNRKKKEFKQTQSEVDWKVSQAGFGEMGIVDMQSLDRYIQKLMNAGLKSYSNGDYSKGENISKQLEPFAELWDKSASKLEKTLGDGMLKEYFQAQRQMLEQFKAIANSNIPQKRELAQERAKKIDIESGNAVKSSMIALEQAQNQAYDKNVKKNVDEATRKGDSSMLKSLIEEETKALLKASETQKNSKDEGQIKKAKQDKSNAENAIFQYENAIKEIDKSNDNGLFKDINDKKFVDRVQNNPATREINELVSKLQSLKDQRKENQIVSEDKSAKIGTRLEADNNIKQIDIQIKDVLGKLGEQWTNVKGQLQSELETQTSRAQSAKSILYSDGSSIKDKNEAKKTLEDAETKQAKVQQELVKKFEMMKGAINVDNIKQLDEKIAKAKTAIADWIQQFNNTNGMTFGEWAKDNRNNNNGKVGTGVFGDDGEEIMMDGKDKRQLDGRKKELERLQKIKNPNKQMQQKMKDLEKWINMRDPEKAKEKQDDVKAAEAEKRRIENENNQNLRQIKDALVNGGITL